MPRKAEAAQEGHGKPFFRLFFGRYPYSGQHQDCQKIALPHTATLIVRATSSSRLWRALEARSRPAIAGKNNHERSAIFVRGL